MNLFLHPGGFIAQLGVGISCTKIKLHERGLTIGWKVVLTQPISWIGFIER